MSTVEREAKEDMKEAGREESIDVGLSMEDALPLNVDCWH